MAWRAVLFDIGGVVVGSPLHAIAAWERETGLPDGFVNRVVVESGSGGAWARLERGELSLADFHAAFEDDCRRAGRELSARTLMERVHGATVPRPVMLAAIGRLRAAALRTAAVTNNWVAGEPAMSALAGFFDVVVESAVEGIRKPDPAIYRLACERLGIAPREAIFLDDVGANLKPARAMGMATIRVTDPETALDELGRLLDLELR